MSLRRPHPQRSVGALRAALLAAVALVVALPASAARYLPLPGGAFDSVLPQDANQRSGRAVIAPFELRETPVTNAEFLAFVQTHPQWRRGGAPAVFAAPGYLAHWAAPLQPGDDAPAQSPVTEVSWFAARAYCDSEGARLPSWLEWESAAAADATRADARADPQWRQRILGWYEHSTPARLPAVGGAPDVNGVRDLNGLVWEWVDDFSALFIAGDSRTQGDPDRLKFCGAGALSIVGRDSYAVLMRVALLSSLNAADSTRALGFRCVRPVAAATSP